MSMHTHLSLRKLENIKGGGKNYWNICWAGRRGRGGASTFFAKNKKGIDFFRRKNDGANAFFDEKNDGAETFLTEITFTAFLL